MSDGRDRSGRGRHARHRDGGAWEPPVEYPAAEADSYPSDHLDYPPGAVAEPYPGMPPDPRLGGPPSGPLPLPPARPYPAETPPEHFPGAPQAGYGPAGWPGPLGALPPPGPAEAYPARPSPGAWDPAAGYDAAAGDLANPGPLGQYQDTSGPYHEGVPPQPYAWPAADPDRSGGTGDPYGNLPPDPYQPGTPDSYGPAADGPGFPAAPDPYGMPAGQGGHPTAPGPSWPPPPPPPPGPSQVAAGARHGMPGDPFGFPAGRERERLDYGHATARPAPPGPAEISGPIPAGPWPDYPEISGPMAAFPGEAGRFGNPEDDPRYAGGYADADGYADAGGYADTGGYGDDSGYGDEGGYADAGAYTDAAGYADDDDMADADDWADEDSGPILPVGERSTARRRGNGRPRRRRSAPLIALVVIVLFLSAGAVAGVHFLRTYVIPPDYSGSGYGSIIVEVKQGDTATDVAQTLFRLGVVASTRAFVKAAEQSSRQTGLEPGFYRLHRHMKAVLAFDLLLTPGARVELRVTIPEGLRLSQIVSRLSGKSGISRGDYLAALAHPGSLGLPPYAHNRPEGYLFPATYPLQPRMTAIQVLRVMVAQFNDEAAKISLVSMAHKVNLKPEEAIIVASLVQAEGGRVADFAKIARVIYNRLDTGMRLQLDSTVMYGLHTYGILASDRQLQSRSPYNTYLRTGLPPGPIDSPGEAAINAALHPAKGNWLYFVTVDPKTGRTEFTSSPAVFSRLRAELEKNLGQ